MEPFGAPSAGNTESGQRAGHWLAAAVHRRPADPPTARPSSSDSHAPSPPARTTPAAIAYGSLPLPTLPASRTASNEDRSAGAAPAWLAAPADPHDARRASIRSAESAGHGGGPDVTTARRPFSFPSRRRPSTSTSGSRRRRSVAKRHRSSLSDADLPARALARLIAPAAAEGGRRRGRCEALSAGGGDALEASPSVAVHRRKEGGASVAERVARLVAAAVPVAGASGGAAAAAGTEGLPHGVPPSEGVAAGRPEPAEAVAELEELLVADSHLAGGALAEALITVPHTLARSPPAGGRCDTSALPSLFHLAGTYLPRPVRVEAVLAMLKAAQHEALPPGAVHAAERAMHALALADRQVAPQVVHAACSALVRMAADCNGSGDAAPRVAFAARLVSTHLRLCDPAQFHGLRPRVLDALSQAMELPSAEAAEVATAHLANLGPAFYASGDPGFSQRVRAVLESRRSLWRDPHVAELAAQLERVFLGDGGGNA